MAAYAVSVEACPHFPESQERVVKYYQTVDRIDLGPKQFGARLELPRAVSLSLADQVFEQIEKLAKLILALLIAME